MGRMTFPIAADGLRLPALLGPDTKAMLALKAQGKPLPSLIPVRAQIDTGNVVTAVGPKIMTALGAVPLHSLQTQTAGGAFRVQVYEISFTIFDPAGNTTLTRTSWGVTDLPQDLPDVEVLFGLDLVRELILIVDGPRGTFSLDF